VPTVPTDDPSTVTPEMLYPLLGVIVKVRFVPLVTVAAPEGEIVPPVPADDVMV